MIEVSVSRLQGDPISDGTSSLADRDRMVVQNDAWKRTV